MSQHQQPAGLKPRLVQSDLADQLGNSDAEVAAVDNPLKSDLSDGNYSTPDLPDVGVIAVQRLESVHSSQMHSLAGMMNDYSTGD